ncbi:MAG: hypothetical protein ACR2JU_03215 [Nocardioidaceae bacterium]
MRRLTALGPVAVAVAVADATPSADAVEAGAGTMRVIGRKHPVPTTPRPEGVPVEVWTEDRTGPAPDVFTSTWDLRDGPRYTSYHFAVYLDGETGLRSDDTRRICVNSTLTRIGHDDGNYYIRLHNEYTPSGRSSGYTGYVSYPPVLNVTYGYCFTSCPDYDRGDVYVAQLSKKNTIYYYDGNMKFTE